MICTGVSIAQEEGLPQPAVAHEEPGWKLLMSSWGQQSQQGGRVQDGPKGRDGKDGGGGMEGIEACCDHKWKWISKCLNFT